MLAEVKRYVCEKYKIPRGTLQNKLARRHGKKPGHQNVLSDIDEKAVVEHLATLGEGRKPMRRKKITVEPGCSVGSTSTSACQPGASSRSSARASNSTTGTDDDSDDETVAAVARSRRLQTHQLNGLTLMTMVMMIQHWLFHGKLKQQQNVGLTT